MRKKDDTYLLVDGYNIIHAWEDLKQLAEESLEDSRDRLIDILCDYNGLVSDKIILVFDAHKVKGTKRTVIEHKGISIVYTKEAETADHYIEKCVNTIIHNYNVKVATSDNLEQVIILAKGAVRLSARELGIQIEQAKEKVRKTYLEKPVIKENLLFDNINAEAAEFLEELRRK